MPSRRDSLFAAAALVVRAEAASPLLLVSIEEAERMRREDGIARRLAEKSLRAGPWSVTFERPPADLVSAGPHDYYSEGPYWWPDPHNPKGPYIRRDGERNPDRFMGNRRALGEMSDAVMALGLGAWMTKEARYADRAAEVLSVWFVDPKTRMNPNLEYGQAVRGHNTGRGTGIIDTVSLIYCAQGIALLGGANKLAAGKWFADYLNWLTTSEKGLDEKNSGNNHATWWTAQVAAYATLVGNSAALKMAWDHYRTVLVPKEIQPDGSCPREEARTQSLGYSSMNLDAFSVLCRIADRNGVDLWWFRAPNGASVERAFDYLIPYVVHPDTWHKQQITKYVPDHVVFPALVGLGLKSDKLLASYRALPRAESPWVRFIDLITQTKSS